MSTYFIREVELRDETSLQIHQIENGDVGVVVWDAALVLTHYLDIENERQKGNFLREKTAIELGAGTGLVAIAAASLGASVIATDLSALLDLMSKNCEENRGVIDANGGRLKVAALSWENPVPKELTSLLEEWSSAKEIPDRSSPDFVFLSDCVYYEPAVKPLVDTLVSLSSPRTTILCSFEERNSREKVELQKRFFSLVAESFDVRFVPFDQMDETFRSPDIRLVLMKIKC